jgi:peptidoglycan hydrolase CwlO-like protein
MAQTGDTSHSMCQLIAAANSPKSALKLNLHSAVGHAAVHVHNMHQVLFELSRNDRIHSSIIVIPMHSWHPRCGCGPMCSQAACLLQAGTRRDDAEDEERSAQDVLREQLQQSSQRCQELQGDVVQLGARLQQSDQHCQELQGDVVQHGARLQRSDQHCQVLQGHVVQLGARLQRSDQHCQELQGDVVQLRAWLQRSDQHCQELQGDVVQLGARLQRSDQHCQELQGDVVQLGARLQRSDQHCQELQGDVVQLRARLQRSDQLRQRVEGDVVRLREKLQVRLSGSHVLCCDGRSNAHIMPLHSDSALPAIEVSTAPCLWLLGCCATSCWPCVLMQSW